MINCARMALNFFGVVAQIQRVLARSAVIFLILCSKKTPTSHQVSPHLAQTPDRTIECLWDRKDVGCGVM